MSEVTRRTFLTTAASAGALALTSRLRAETVAPLPPIPLSIAIATERGHAVVETAWLETQVAAMEALMGPFGVHPIVTGTRTIAERYAHMGTREDRDALYAELRPNVANVFLVGSLRDVDEPALMRRGVHWRNRLHSAARYVIVSAIAPESVLAHEMGHYFGLNHTQVKDNLMSYDRSGGPVFLDPAQKRVIATSARDLFRTGELVARPSSAR